MKTAVIVFSTHLKVESLRNFVNETQDCDKVVFFTPQYVFENERKIIDPYFANTEYVCFADFMTDADGERCDLEAFYPFRDEDRLSVSDSADYFHDLTRMKNEILVRRICEKYNPNVKIILSDDLGIDLEVWQQMGFIQYNGEYYYTTETGTSIQKKPNIVYRAFRKLYRKTFGKLLSDFPRQLFVARYNGKKIVFHGCLDRAGYRIGLQFKKNIYESCKYWFVKHYYVKHRVVLWQKDTIHMSTLHEYSSGAYLDMIDAPQCANYLFQDGLLPGNDCCRYLFFYGRHTKFWTWDKLGDKLFEYHAIPSEIFPFRRNYPVPKPSFKSIKKVLCVSSGAGDWTAIKNRSDEDKTAVAIVEIAKRYPQIEFVYRCHPTWISPVCQGVNSIQRLVEYFDSTGLKNITLSSNIPSYYDKFGNKIASQKRSSLSEDLQSADFVFGVHSISMIDAALQNIPFASINMSGRRNLFQSISELGFPHCESVEEIACVLDSVLTLDFQKQYLQAVENYNRIIEEK